jgi:hypothetical protein
VRSGGARIRKWRWPCARVRLPGVAGLAALDDLRGLRIGRDAMLQRLAHFHASHRQVQAVLAFLGQAALDQALEDQGIARGRRLVAVDPMQGFEERQVLEGDRFHGKVPWGHAGLVAERGCHQACSGERDF